MGELTWPILITFEVAALAVVPRKITGPAIAVAPTSLRTSRRRHNLLEEFAGFIFWEVDYAPCQEIGPFMSQVPRFLSQSPEEEVNGSLQTDLGEGGFLCAKRLRRFYTPRK